MKRINILLIFLLVLLLPACTGIGNAGGKSSSELVVSAAASLKEALDDIKKLWDKENRDITLTMNFGSSGSLQQQIEQGADVDVFVSAASKQMDTLEEKGLLMEETRFDLLANKMVLVIPLDSEGLASFNDLTSGSIEGIAVGEPKSVPAGQYAEEILTFAGVWDSLRSKLVYAKDVKSVLAWVETGNADAGIVYQTDAVSSSKVKIAAVAPEGSHSPVLYPVAIIKDSDHFDGATAFIKLLQSEKAKKAFESCGFTFLYESD